MKASESRGDKVFVNYLENTVEGRARLVLLMFSRAKFILKHPIIKDYNLLNHMHFLRDVLAVLSSLSFKFQKDSYVLPYAVEALETATLQLVALQQPPGEKLQFSRQC